MKRRSKPAVSKRPRRRRRRAENRLRTVFSEQQVRKRVRELGREISRDYRGRTVHLVGILEHSFMFIADLMRGLKRPVISYFIKVETRDGAQGKRGLRELIFTPKLDFTGKHILLVDEILQSGVVQDHLYHYILEQNPATLSTVTLVEKTVERKVDLPMDYRGFRTSAKFLVGYGLGHQEGYRNLPYIAALTSSGGAGRRI